MSPVTTDTLDRAVEALLFSAEAAIAPETLARAFEHVTGTDVTAGEIDGAVERLNAAYRTSGRVFRVYRWGGGYRLATIEEVAPFVRALRAEEGERGLSRALLETLAVIAYNQPITKPEVDHVRGVNADYALRQLLERDFITVVGRSEGVGRPLLYGTTAAFLDRFGLGALDDLPKPREIEELLADPAFSHERAVLSAERAQHTASEQERERGGGASSNGSPPPRPPDAHAVNG